MKLLPEIPEVQRGYDLVALRTSWCAFVFLMSSKVKIEKWLHADWGHARSDQGITKNKDDNLKSCRKNEEQPDIEGARRTSNANEIAPAIENNLLEEDKDYSESASSWEPSGGSSTSEDSDADAEKSKTLQMEQYLQQYVKRRRGKKVPLPMHRPNAVGNVLQERKINENNRSLNDTRKRKYQEIHTINKSLPDSTRKNISPPKQTDKTINIRMKDILEIKETFEELFTMLNNMKPEPLRRKLNSNKIIKEEKGNINNTDYSQANEEMADINEHEERSDRSQSEESNRSDDNVLITNKYHKARVSPKNQNNEDDDDEWVPIGSGKTLIHKDKYRKVNWKSYTIATRTLLLATFPRRILATHSLTGKRSPAFLNKPPKMCLDPKIVSDIIIEITSKFKVKENLVRGIITTKCADECKMLKMRLKNKNAPLKGFNVPNNSLIQTEQVMMDK